MEKEPKPIADIDNQKISESEREKYGKERLKNLIINLNQFNKQVNEKEWQEIEDFFDNSIKETQEIFNLLNYSDNQFRYFVKFVAKWPEGDLKSKLQELEVTLESDVLKEKIVRK
mgnify:CR=1 FL=1